MSEQRFHQYQVSEPLVQAASLALAIGQISELPNAIAGQLGWPLRVAAIESFMVNVRLVGDFLLKNNERDLRPEDFRVPWSRQMLAPEPTEGDPDRLALRARLDSHWKDASSFVVHFGKRRYDRLVGQPMNEATMTAIAIDALTALAPFIRAVIDSAPAGEVDAQLPAADDDDAWAKRALIERARSLHEEFLQASGRLGLDGSRLLVPVDPN